MVRTFTKETSGSELVTGLVGTIDVGELLTKVIDYNSEVANTSKILDDINNAVSNLPLGYGKDLEQFVTQDFEEVRSSIDAQMGGILKLQASWLRDQSLASVLGFPAQATMHGLYSTYDKTFSNLSTYWDCIYGIKAEMLEDHALRYWNKLWAPNICSVEEALRLVRFGFLGRSDWVGLKQEKDGISNDQADKIFTTLYRIPEEQIAFKLLNLGAITQDQYEQVLMKHGWDSTYYDTITQAYYYRMTFRDLTRMADYVPMDSVYLGKVLHEDGYLDTDIPRMVSYLQMRPLRAEYRSVGGRWLYEYANGRITQDALLGYLANSGFLQPEINIYKTWSNLQYTDNLVDLQVDTIYWKAYKGQYTTQEEISTDLNLVVQDKTWCNLKAWDLYWNCVFVDETNTIRSSYVYGVEYACIDKMFTTEIEVYNSLIQIPSPYTPSIAYATAKAHEFYNHYVYPQQNP